MRKLVSRLCAFLIVNFSVGIAAVQADVLVSPALPPTLAKSLRKDFGAAGDYILGDSSDFLLLVEYDEVEHWDSGWFVSTYDPKRGVSLSLIDGNGRRIAKGKAAGSKEAKALIKAYKSMMKAAKKKGLKAPSKTDWLTAYHSIYVMRAVHATQPGADPSFQSLMHALVAEGSLKAATSLSNYAQMYGGTVKENGDTLLHTAAATGRRDLFDFALGLDSNVEAKNTSGYTPLDIASNASPDFFKYVASHSGPASAGALNNALATLVYAYVDAKRGNDPVGDFIRFRADFEWLADAGADLKQSWQRDVPLEQTIISRRKQELLDYLIDTPLYQLPLNERNLVTVALKTNNNQALKSLLANGATTASNHYFDAVASNNSYAVSALYNRGVALPNEGKRLVSLAFNAKNYRLMDTLLVAGAAVPDKSSNGSTLLHVAADRGHTDAIRSLGRYYDVNAKDKKGRTALHYAMPRASESLSASHENLIDVLVELGGDVSLGDNSNKDPFQAYYTARAEYEHKQEVQRLRKEQQEREVREAKRRRAEEKRRADAALHRTLVDAAQQIGTAIGNAYMETQNVKRQQQAQQNRIMQQQREDYERRVREAQQSYSQSQTASKNATQMRQKYSMKATEYRRNTGTKGSVNPLGFIVNGPVGASSSAPTSTIVNPQRPKPTGRDEFDVVRTKRTADWMANAFSACNITADGISLRRRTDNMGDALAAFKVGCKMAHVYSVASKPQLLYCGRREEIMDKMRQELAKKGIAGHASYGENAWDAWKSEVGCARNDHAMF